MSLSRSLPALALRSLAVAALLFAGACGSEIGDSCQSATDCESDGTRVCDLVSDSDGYCTIIGCDHDSCPDEAVCVRFFGGTFANKTCNHATEDLLASDGTREPTDDCSLDEFCTLQDHCALRASEIRYCMRSCSSNDDCRADYECRDRDLMIMHGGEPVLPADERVGDSPSRFCALKGS
jgi:hypothetical protein